MQGSLEIIIRTFTSFLLLWIFISLIGKQTIAHRSNHLYVASITMGTIGGNLAFNIKIKFLYFIIALILMGAIVYILNILAARNFKYRKWIAGEPSVLIKDGKLHENTMKKIGYSLDTLMQDLRGRDIFDMEEADCAILEVNGTLSVKKKPQFQPLSRQDLDGALRENGPIELIMDGVILTGNLAISRFNEDWLMAELKKKNLSVSDISYAVAGSKDNLYVEQSGKDSK
ncbi:DUF421 domain-containing protein [Peribacillus sp. B-H-3]|uniref:DUF421 domain-containing protein n=1 Tax=Peribacillus sp. B-H-3 TaxID=3400420 RepID=UPI003B0191F5